jgi:hypothetical protein
MPFLEDVAVTVTVFTAPTLPCVEPLVVVRTTYPEIDEQVANHAELVEGMLVGYEIIVSRKFEGGPVRTVRTSMSISELTDTSIGERMFTIPSGFTYQEPQVGFAAPNF